MKVLFLTRYPESGASSRYRVFQYLPYLHAADIEWQVSPFMDEAMYGRTFSRGGTGAKIAFTAAAILRRLRWLLRSGQFDLIYMQRECLPLGGAWMEALLGRAGAHTVFDMDDALFLEKPSKYNPLATHFRRGNKVFEICEAVDTVMAGNPWLQSKAAEYCEDSRYFPVAENLQRFRAKASYSSDKPTLVWLGSSSTEKYLEALREPLQSLARRLPGLTLRVIGGGDFADAAFDVEHVAWSLEAEVEGLLSADVGVMPLPHEEWAKGKCGGKARTYMACGLPAVVSDIGYNQCLIDDGVTGFLVADDSKQWEQRMYELLTDSALRERVGAAAREVVRERYDIERLGPEFAATLNALVAERKPA